MRLPGFGGAGLFLRRSIASESNRPGADVWLVDPRMHNGVLGREVDRRFWLRLARYLFDVAGAQFPDRDVPAFLDASSGLSVDVGTSDSNRVGLQVLVTGLDDPDCPELGLRFESTRAALANAAIGVQSLFGSLDLADFEELAR
jgi:hypothetical protein